MSSISFLSLVDVQSFNEQDSCDKRVLTFYLYLFATMYCKKASIF